MTTVVATPDVELSLVAFLNATLTGAQAATETPPDLDAQLPFYRVTLVTGNDIVPTLGQIAVDIDAFAIGRPAANTAALAAKDAMTYQLRGFTDHANGAAFGEVVSSTWPSWRPWDNTTLRRVGATYILTVHAIKPS